MEQESNPATAPAEPRPHSTADEIAARAFEIWQARGGTHGADMDDWLQAERELSESAR